MAFGYGRTVAQPVRPLLPAPASGLARAAMPAAAPAPAPSLQQQAQAEIGPLLKQVQAKIAAQTARAGQAIQGYTGSLASAIGGQDYAAPYQGAETQQAAVDAALASALSGQGTTDAQGLSARLAQLNEPGVVGQAAQAVAGNAAGNSNTVLASGSSNIGQLIANQAAALSYGQKLPGIAKLAGLQSLASVQQSGVKDLADQTTTIESQLPSIVNALRSAQLTEQAQKATADYRQQEQQATADYRGKVLTQGDQRIAQGDQRLNVDTAYKSARLGLDQQSLDALNKYRNGELTLSQLRAQLEGQRLSNETASKPNASLSRAEGHLVDQYGNSVGGATAGSRVVASRISVWNAAHPDAVIDPAAALAVSSKEGAGGGVGDGGTSFGPFQLHAGGALPASVWAKGADYAQRWAWSTQGIDYALGGIAAAAGGLTGEAAVQNIVSRFERPANPGAEIAGATAALSGEPLPGYKIDASGSYVKASTASTAPKPLTVNEAAKFTKSAVQIATNARTGGTDTKTGVYHPPISFQQALEEQRVAGNLADPRTAKIAVAALMRAYGVTEAAIAAGRVAGPPSPGVKP